MNVTTNGVDEKLWVRFQSCVDRYAKRAGMPAPKASAFIRHLILSFVTREERLTEKKK